MGVELVLQRASIGDVLINPYQAQFMLRCMVDLNCSAGLGSVGSSTGRSSRK